jgi:hypothetical protein
MKGKVILVLFFIILVVVPIISLGKHMPEANPLRLDPGWIRGPIWGRIDGYEFRGTDNETLLFYAKNVHYFGIGHAFDSGFYPRHWINQEITASYSFFEGFITIHFIFGKIYGLPNQ